MSLLESVGGDSNPTRRGNVSRQQLMILGISARIKSNCYVLHTFKPIWN